MSKLKHKRPKAQARKRKAKPLARLGVPIHIGIAQVVLDTLDGPQSKYYWWASERPDLSPEEIAQDLHGPFDTEAAADEAARIAAIGPDCEISEGGTWDPRWEKPQ